LSPHEFIRANPGAVVIARSRYAAGDLVRAACESALLGIQRYTFRGLVYALSTDAMNARGLTPLGRIAREAIVASVARQVELKYLHDVVRFPGFPAALANTLRDLRLDRVPRSKLRDIGRSGADLAALLEAYEVELGRLDFADYASRVELAIERARAILPAPVLLLGLEVETVAERELCDTLVNRAPAHLIASGSKAPASPGTAIQAVQRFALSGERAPERSPDASVAFLSASSEALEFVEIARRALHSAVPFDQIAILLRNPRRHGPLVREALQRAGIPAHYTGGTDHADVGGRAFLTLLRCREMNYSALVFAEYLSLGQVPREEGEVPPSSAWERLLRDAAVIHTVPRWRSRLTVLLDRLYAEYEKETPEERKEHKARDIAATESLRGFAVPLIERLAALPERALWGEWLGPLEDLATHSLAWPRTVHEALDELAPLAALGPVNLAEVIRTFERVIADYRDDVDEPRYGKLFVSSIEEARGMQFRLVFIPGLNEGMFPRQRREDPLLLDAQRVALGMRTAIEDSELLRTALACASESAVFSFARVDLATGRERVPSFFAVEVLKAAHGSSADIPKLLEQAKAASESRIGWSAPNDPADSIDDIEFDLASFRAASVAKVRGGYAWIGAVNPHAVRSINARIERWGREWSKSDGLAATDVHIGIALRKYRLTERAWSASALQQFARCPYRFLLHGIYGLEPVEEPEALERMDALVRGRLYHRVLFHLFRDGDQDALARLENILPRLAAETAEEHAPAIPGFWRTEVEKLRADLRGWLSGREADWSPAHVELAFGTEDFAEHDGASTADPAVIEGGVRLRGSIDLIERRSDGRIRVIDHKTGKFPDKPPLCIGNGEVLQPLLYALAVEALLGEAPAQSILSYATLRGGYHTVAVPINTYGRERVRRVPALIDKWIDQGFLPAAPKRGGCERCEYLPVCGPYEELRVSGKPQPDLRELVEIRRLA
jgi:CRISPR/Cas system-associated exonuclease Cas4 (RecB family)